MKLHSLWFCLVIISLFSQNVFSQFGYTREERESLPRTISRSGYLTWLYDSITIKNAEGKKETFSYLNQLYGLDLSGPLIFPGLGVSKLSLTYHLGKNVLGYPWVTKDQQKLYTYHFSALLLPPSIRRFICLSIDLSRSVRDQFSPSNSQLLYSNIRTNSIFSLSLSPPGRINLSGLFGKKNNKFGSNRRNRKNDFFVFNLPRLSYTYRKINALNETNIERAIDQDTILQFLRVYHNWHELYTEYQVDYEKNINLLQKLTLSEGINRQVSSRIGFNQPFWGAQSLSLWANYSTGEALFPSRIKVRESASTSATLTTKSVTFFRITSSGNYSNSTNWDLMLKTWIGANTLGLNSYAYLRRNVYLYNGLSYFYITGKTISRRQQLSENLQLRYFPFPVLDLTSRLQEIYRWDGGKIQEEGFLQRIDFTPWALLSSSLSYEIKTTKDLLKKEIVARNTYENLSLGGQISPFVYLLNNNNNNNNNHKNNNNQGYYANLLTLSYNWGFGWEKDLLKGIVTRSKSQIYGLKSAPFNNYLTIALSYSRQESITDGQPRSLDERFTMDITSQAGLRLWGITFNLKVYTGDLKRADTIFTADYSVGRSSFKVGYRIIEYSSSTPYNALSTSFTRTF